MTIANGASITLNDATISGGIVCNGTAEITLVGTNSVTGASQKAGIQVGGSGTTLTIKGDGSLTANGVDQSAGIGLSRAWGVDATGGDILIEGGNITANGSVNDKWGAGIGTGVIYGGTARIGNITIKGGSVKATGGSEANGIGTGYTYGGCTNTIGTVTIYDGIDKVDASSISESVTYMHVENETETDVTANKSDYFTIIEDGNLTIADGIEHGTLTGAATAKYMENVTITATPDFGYRLSRLVVKDAQNNDVESTGNSFFMPKSNVTVSAVFEQSVHGTTEFTWSHWSVGQGWVTDAIIYDGVTTVNLQKDLSYSILKYEGNSPSIFRLDIDTDFAPIPYSGGTGTFYNSGNPTQFGLDGEATAGYYDITMTEADNGKWSVSILKTAGQMDVVPDQTYTGSAITPEPTVIAGSLNLTKGTDYEYSYENNTNAGTATVRATFLGTYAWLGSVEKEFTIVYPTVTTSYVDATGTLHENVEAVPLDNTMTTISEGWYVVNSDVTFNGDLSTNADDEVHIILCDGATLTANNITPIGNYDILRIYGQSQSTGTANISGRIEASSSLQIYGGTINAAGNIVCDQSGVGIHGGNVTAAKINGYEGSLYLKGGTITAGSLTVDHGDIKLGGATVTAGSYNVTEGNVTILTGITYYDGTGASYTAGNLSADQVSAIAGKKLRTYDYRTVSYVKADGTTGSVDAIPLTGGGATALAGGWYVAQGEVNYTGCVTLSGDAHLILCDGAEMSVDGSGISLECNGALTIYGQSGGTGTLTLKSNQTTISVIGNLTICSGSVSATSSGDDVINTTGDIILKGGTLTACADDGTSRAINCSGTLNLSGGKVVATNGAIYAKNGATIASGLAYTDGSTAYTTSISSNDLEALGAVTLELADDGTPEEEVLSLTDNEAYTQQSQIDGVDVCYTRDFSKYWEAIYLPFSLKYEDWKDDFEVARINAVHQYDTNDDGDIDKTELEFVKMTDDESVIEPNTPYLIKAKTSGEKTLSVENTTVYKADVNQIECSTTTEKFIFTGNYETIPYETLIAKKYYAMGGGELVMSNGSDLGPYRWYMARENRNSVYGINNNSANAKEISINVVGEETTGIADIQHPSPDTPTYDLNGRRVNENNLKPGIYVKNGKKFVVK